MSVFRHRTIKSAIAQRPSSSSPPAIQGGWLSRNPCSDRYVCRAAGDRVLLKMMGMSVFPRPVAFCRNWPACILAGVVQETPSVTCRYIPLSGPMTAGGDNPVALSGPMVTAIGVSMRQAQLASCEEASTGCGFARTGTTEHATNTKTMSNPNMLGYFVFMLCAPPFFVSLSFVSLQYPS